MKLKKILALISAAAMALSLASCGNQRASNESDWDAIEGKGEMVVGITLFQPMNYMEDGELVGFETEFAQAVCEKLGVDAKFQEINWDSKEIELSSKNIDCIWNGMTITDDLKKNLSITKPYMENKQAIVAKQGSTYSSLEGLNIVTEAGSAGEELANENDDFKDAKVVGVDSQAKALMDLEMGTADAAVVDYVAAIGSIGEDTDFGDLVILDNFEYMPEYYGIAFRKDSDAKDKVQEAIDSLMSDGTVEQIAEKYKLQDLIQK